MNRLVRQLALLALVLPSAALAQMSSGSSGTARRFEPTTSSAEARSEYRLAIWHFENAFAVKGTEHVNKALALDPQFGLARILHGQSVPGLTPAQRQEEMTQGVALLAKAPTAELLFGMGLREWASGRQPAAKPIFAAALALLPEDQEIGYWDMVARSFGRPMDERIANARATTVRFPDKALTYRTLGYGLFASGDHAGGIAAMREHVRREPDHPNSHESLAEVLAGDGQYDEAIREDERAVALDPSFTGAYSQLADIKLALGDVKQARGYWQQATAHSIRLADTVNFAHSTALSYLLEGDPKTAMSQVGDVSRRADQSRPVVPGGALAPLAHQELAAMEALYGNAGSVSMHLASAAQMGDSASPTQFAYTAFSLAATKRLDEARAAAGRFSTVANTGNVFGTHVLFRHTLDGFIALQANNPAAAVAEFTQAASNDILAKELLAEAYSSSGKQPDAQALREQVRKGPAIVYGGEVVNFWAALAKARAKQGKVS